MMRNGTTFDVAVSGQPAVRNFRGGPEKLYSFQIPEIIFLRPEAIKIMPFAACFCNNEPIFCGFSYEIEHLVKHCNGDYPSGYDFYPNSSL